MAAPTRVGGKRSTSTSEEHSAGTFLEPGSLLAVALNDPAADDRPSVAGRRFERPHPALYLHQHDRDGDVVLKKRETEPIFADQDHVADRHDAIVIGIADDILPNRVAIGRRNEGLEGIGHARWRMAIDRPAANETEFCESVAILARGRGACRYGQQSGAKPRHPRQGAPFSGTLSISRVLASQAAAQTRPGRSAVASGASVSASQISR